MNKRTLRFSLTLFVLLLAGATSAFAQAQTDKSEKLSVSLALNHDAFFGFNPALALSYPVGAKTDLTFYGIQWGAGTASAWGNWTEFGLGANFKAGNFAINPQLGFTMGSLLSSGAARPGIVGDGIVPNLTVNHDSKRFLGQFYAGYYAALRNNTKQEGQATNNYTHYWVNGGVKATSWLALGAHYEHLYLSGGNSYSGTDLVRTDGYQWIGPFVQVSKKAAGLRFSFGADIDDQNKSFSKSDFYKMSFFVNL